MGEATECFFKWIDIEGNREAAQARVAECVATFREASTLAAQHGMRLTQRSPEHYQLRRYKPQGLWNLYPRSAKPSPRIVTDKRFIDRTHLQLGGVAWTLLDVVNEAIRVTEETAVAK